MLVSHHTIYCHTRLTAFHSETGAALTDGDVHMPYIGAIQTVMGQHMEILGTIWVSDTSLWIEKRRNEKIKKLTSQNRIRYHHN